MMSMIIFVFIFITGALNAGVATEVAYSNACIAGQCGDWQKAQQQLSNLVIDEPENPALLYDNGVAAYRMQEYEKSRAYFQGVTKQAETDVQLKKQAHFNCGNAHAMLNELSEAIEQYEAVLAIDPHDERAKHNLEKIRELLKQQQQEQEQQKQQQNQDNDKQDQDQQQQQGDGQNQQQQNNQGDQNQEKQNQEGQQNNSDNQSGDDQSAEHDQKPSDGNNQGDQKDQANRESAGQDQNKKQDQLGNGHDSSPEGDDQSDPHTITPEQKQDKENEMADGQSSAMQMIDEAKLDEDVRDQEREKIKQAFAPHEQWMARLLQQRENADDRAHKQLMKAHVDKNMAGNHGQNNW